MFLKFSFNILECLRTFLEHSNIPTEYFRNTPIGSYTVVINKVHKFLFFTNLTLKITLNPANTYGIPKLLHKQVACTRKHVVHMKRVIWQCCDGYGVCDRNKQFVGGHFGFCANRYKEVKLNLFTTIFAYNIPLPNTMSDF